MRRLSVLTTLCFVCLLSGTAAAQTYTVTDFGTLGGTYSQGFGINTAGQVTGSAALVGDTTYHAFLYSNGVMTDLNTTIPSGSGWTLSGGVAINDNGQITGYGVINGETHAFLLTPTGYTSTGSNVSVTPTDSISGGTPVSITFGAVTSDGSTTLTTTSTGAPPPSGFKIGNPPVYYDVKTTAVFTGSATVCINYSGISYGNVNNLKLFHYENGVWVDRTISLSTVTSTICAGVTSFSPCAIFETSYPFTGFFAPVGNLPTLNNVQAGAAIAVKFILGSNLGLGILKTGYPISQVIVCTTQAPSDVSAATVTAGSSRLTYDSVANQYVYIWKTDKTWANSCRRLNMTLNDGSLHVANFQFTK